MRQDHHKRDDKELREQMLMECDTDPEKDSEPPVPMVLELGAIRDLETFRFASLARIERYKTRKKKYVKNRANLFSCYQIDRQRIADDARSFEEKALRDRGVRDCTRGSAGRVAAESQLVAIFGRVWWHDSCADRVRRGFVSTD